MYREKQIINRVKQFPAYYFYLTPFFFFVIGNQINGLCLSIMNQPVQYPPETEVLSTLQVTKLLFRCSLNPKKENSEISPFNKSTDFFL